MQKNFAPCRSRVGPPPALITVFSCFVAALDDWRPDISHLLGRRAGRGDISRPRVASIG